MTIDQWRNFSLCLIGVLSTIIKSCKVSCKNVSIILLFTFLKNNKDVQNMFFKNKEIFYVIPKMIIADFGKLLISPTGLFSMIQITMVVWLIFLAKLEKKHQKWRFWQNMHKEGVFISVLTIYKIYIMFLLKVYFYILKCLWIHQN